MSNIILDIFNVILNFFKKPETKKFLKKILWNIIEEIARIIKKKYNEQKSDFV